MWNIVKNWTKNKIDIPGYTFGSLECKGKKGGGVGVLINESRKYRWLNLPQSHPSTFEAIVIELKCDKQNVTLASCYRAPNTNQDKFNKQFGVFLDNIQRDTTELIIGMDHNMDLLKNSEHCYTQLLWKHTRPWAYPLYNETNKGNS